MVKCFGKNGFETEIKSCSTGTFSFIGFFIVEKPATIETSQNASIEISAHTLLLPEFA